MEYRISIGKLVILVSALLMSCSSGSQNGSAGEAERLQSKFITGVDETSVAIWDCSFYSNNPNISTYLVSQWTYRIWENKRGIDQDGDYFNLGFARDHVGNVYESSVVLEYEVVEKQRFFGEVQFNSDNSYFEAESDEIDADGLFTGTTANCSKN